ncbi:protein RIC-3 [Ascaphus truei]|uniref:protein RIC-3 n=1 Tax=Ascaphus truei TaxID=8439 RepID=UPI003F59F6D5
MSVWLATFPILFETKMALSTIQKVALFSCLVLCVSLLLPKTLLTRGKPSGQPEGTSGRFPSAVHPPKPTDGRTAGSHFPRSHLSEAVSKAKGGSGGGAGGGTRQSLVGQIIPIYGFGILLYILYILFKLSSKGKNTKVEQKCQPVSNGNLKRKITDYELGQLQDKLKETEEAMEKIIHRLGPNCESVDNVSTDEEQQLLQRLKEITRVMKDGKLLDSVSPEQEAEEAPYMEDWEGYPEETYPIYDNANSSKRSHKTILVDCSVLTQLSAEEIAERMEFVEDEDQICTESLEERNGSPAVKPNKAQHVTFIAQNDILQANDNVDKCHYLENEEEDPAVIAENAGFESESCSEQGDQCTDGFFIDLENDSESPEAINNPSEDETGMLRKRNKKGT